MKPGPRPVRRRRPRARVASPSRARRRRSGTRRSEDRPAPSSSSSSSSSALHTAVRVAADRVALALERRARPQQHPLGVVAASGPARSPSSASVDRPASSTHDLTCALATGSRTRSRCSCAPCTVNGGNRPSRASIRAPISSQRLGDPVDRTPADRLVAVERELRPCWNASHPGSSRISVPALPTSIRPAGCWALRSPHPRITARRRRAARRSRRARAPRRASSWCPRPAGSCGSRRARRPSRARIAARCEIDLSAGTREAAAERARRLEARVHARTTGKPSAGDQLLARGAHGCSPEIHSATTPSLMSGAGYSAMSAMLTPARPSSSASCATTPGRFGTDARSSNSGPPASCASSSRRRSARRRVVPGRDPRRRRRPSSAPRTLAQRCRSRRRSRRRARRGWRGRCRSRSRSRRPRPGSRRGSSDRSPAAARPSVRASAPPGRRARSRARAGGARRPRGSCRGVSGSIAAGPRADPREQAVQPLVQHARGRRASASGTRSRRRTGPARACSTPEVSAPASGWPPTNRGSSTRGDDGALGRADVGDHAVAGRGGERLADHLRRARRPAPRRTPRRRPRPRPATVPAIRCAAPRSSAALRRRVARVVAGDLGAEPLAARRARSSRRSARRR